MSNSKLENTGLSTQISVRAAVDPSNLSPQGLYIMIYNFKRLVRIFFNGRKWHKNHLLFPQTASIIRVYTNTAWFVGLLGCQRVVFHTFVIIKTLHSTHHLCSHKTHHTSSPAVFTFLQSQFLCTCDKQKWSSKGLLRGYLSEYHADSLQNTHTKRSLLKFLNF